jgi:integrase
VKKLMQLTEQLENSRPLTAESLANYRRAVQKYSDYIGIDAEIKDLEDDRINAFLRSLEDELSNNTIRNIRRDFLIVWRFAAYKKLCEMPMSRNIRLLPADDFSPKAWPVEWIPRLISAASNMPGRVKSLGIERAVFAEAYLRVCLDLICRPKDVRGLEWSCIAKNGGVAFRQSKTRRMLRGKLRNETMVSLEPMRDLGQSMVFPLSKSSVEYVIRLIFQHAKISKPVGESFGHFRHTGGTHIAKKLGNDRAKKALGHSPDSKVFEKHYQEQSEHNPDDVLNWWG